MRKIGFAVFIVAALFLISSCQSNDATSIKVIDEEEKEMVVDEETPSIPQQLEDEIEDTMARNVIEITSSGFNPSKITIDKDDSVTFINKGNSKAWPASALHPTHKVYPGSDIEKCDTAEESNIFDACRGLENGESYSFTFNERGIWNYHDHLKSSNFGSIVVR